MRGRVQGVGFRAFAAREAQRLGLAGEVRNRADGAVDVEAEGERAALETLLETLRRGPPAAVVTDVEARFGEGPPRHGGFHIGRSF